MVIKFVFLDVTVEINLIGCSEPVLNHREMAIGSAGYPAGTTFQ